MKSISKNVPVIIIALIVTAIHFFWMYQKSTEDIEGFEVWLIPMYIFLYFVFLIVVVLFRDFFRFVKKIYINPQILKPSRIFANLNTARQQVFGDLPSIPNVTKLLKENKGSLIALAAIILLIIYGITKGGKTETNKTNYAIVYNNAWDDSVFQVEDYLDKSLKDPGSYESIEWSDVRTTDNGYFVTHKYRARNSYGGYVISDKVFHLNKNGLVMGAVDN